ncbi:DNA/RNA nuclease SfsA [Maricaulis maris]|jgi:sugar fermentation stimulation protein A|uniref:DNA/RNA nuclease SfsA n=1 Tax=Maricaulis maris TaxID=74318 RepID=UPI002925A64F|nr:sugar fermentation stimulation protein [Maricaulis maris]
MKFATELVRGRLIKRYKRFFADVELESGETVTAHCANTGAMTGIKTPGLTVWLSRSDNPKRKLKYTWELVEAEGTMIGALPNLANALAEEAVEAGVIAELAGYDSLRREVKYGTNSRIDLLLEGGERPPCWVEVKNVHWQRGPGIAEFPDGVTSRGAKHLVELAGQVAAGERAVQLFIVQRSDCDVLRPAADIDPVYAQTLRESAGAGVEVLAYACDVSPEAVTITRPMRVELGS